MRTILLAGAAGAALALATSAPALAQTAGGEETRRVETILVTARKVQENLQNTPVSIEAFTAAKLEQVGARNLFDVVALTPNLVIEQRSTRDERPAIRGIGTTDIDPTRRTVSYFINGAPFYGAITKLPLGDVERIEVIRGPQGAVFGRATFAGAINYVLKRPGDTLEGMVAGEIAEHDSHALRATLSGPLLGDSVMFRLGASASEYGGEHRNLFSNRIYGAEKNRSASAALILAPSSAFEAEVNLVWSQDRDAPPAYGQFPFLYKQCLTGRNVDFQARSPLLARSDSIGISCGELEAKDIRINQDDTRLPGGPGYDQDTFVATLALTFDLAGLEFKSVSAYTDQISEARDNQSRVPISSFDFDALVGAGRVNTFGAQAIDIWKFKVFSQEFRLTTPQDRPLRAMIGVSYGEERFRITRTFGSGPLGFPDTDTVKNTALFGAINWDVTPKLSLSLEGRQQSDKISRLNSDSVTPAGATNPAQRVRRVLEGSVTFESFLPRVIVDYQLSDSVMIYASYAEGERPGATDLTAGTRTIAPTNVAVPTTNVEGAPLLPEEQNTFEIGVRSTLLDGALQLNATLFRTDWKKIFTIYTFQDLTTQPPTLRTIRSNSGDAELQGLELQAEWAPIDPLTLGFSYGYIDSQYVRGFITREAVDLLGRQGAIDAIAGKRARYVPEHSAAITGAWRDTLSGDWDYFINGDLSYQGKRFAEELNVAYYGPSTRLNLTAGVTNGAVTAEVFGRNVTDDDTILSSGRFLYLGANADGTPDPRRAGSPGGGLPTLGQNFIVEGGLPRGPQWGARIKYRF